MPISISQAFPRILACRLGVEPHRNKLGIHFFGYSISDRRKMNSSIYDVEVDTAQNHSILLVRQIVGDFERKKIMPG